ncbi:MAG TPA: BPL-N domain-containing protein [Pirellulales bacterium]|nr:BPL-N domain-containing protein [Pirellulales bacterium]
MTRNLALRIRACIFVVGAIVAASVRANDGSAAPPPASASPIRVAIYTINQDSDPKSYKLLHARDDLRVTYLRGFDIRAGRLDDFDLLFVPGGSASKQARFMEEEGREKVREFVRHGGGYMGICAGGYLATCSYDWGLNILDAKTVDREHWARGIGTVEIELSRPAQSLFESNLQRVLIHYGNGPILAPAENDQIPDFEVLATYRSEVTKKNVPGGVMPDTPAAVRSTYGKGRVIVFSCHPDIPTATVTEGLQAWLPRMIYWAAGRDE